MTIQSDAVNEAERTIEFSASSETTVDRHWWKEILDHKVESIRLGRINDGAPLLFMHDPYKQIGVIQKCWLDEESKQLRVIAKISKNEEAENIFRDVQDGIITKISIGYRIHKLALDSKEEDKETYRIIDWEPFEASVVSIPADNSVGIGRNEEFSEEKLTALYDQIKNLNEEVRNIKIKEVNTMKEDLTQEEIQALEAKRKTEIEAIAKRHKLEYQWALESDISVEQFRGFALERIGSGTNLYTPSTDLGLSAKEAKRYSFARALRAQLGSEFAKDAGYELELSAEIEKRLGVAPKGIYIPYDIQKRDLTAGGATSGKELVGTEQASASFIDLLRNKLLAKKLGARILSGLKGNIAIPKWAGAASYYWVAEGVAITESNPVTGQVLLSPKTGGASVDISRQLLLQSDPSAEMLVENDIALVCAAGLDKAVFHGTGADGQPTGIALTNGIGAVAGAGFTYAKAIELQTDVEDANADVETMHYVTTPQVRGLLKTREKVANYPSFICSEDNKVAGYGCQITKQIAAGSMFFGDFSQVVIGEWGVLDIMVDPYSNSRSGNIVVVALQSVDVAVRQPGAFSLATGIN